MSGEQSIRGARFRSNLFVFIIYRRGHGVLSGPCDAQLAEGEVSSLTWVRHHAKGSSLGIPELLPHVCVWVYLSVFPSSSLEEISSIAVWNLFSSSFRCCSFSVSLWVLKRVEKVAPSFSKLCLVERN